MSVMISALRPCSVRLYFQLFVGGLVSYLRYLCLFMYSSVIFVLFVLSLVYTILQVSLDGPLFDCPCSDLSCLVRSLFKVDHGVDV